MEAKIGGHGQYVSHATKTTRRSLAYPRHVRRKTTIAAPHCTHNPRPLPALTLVFLLHTTQKPSQASSDFSSICKAQTNLASLSLVWIYSLSLSLPLRSLATLQDQSLVASAYAHSPSKCEARYGSHKKKMRPRTFAYRPVGLDST
jgi:hypothetical protein